MRTLIIILFLLPSLTKGQNNYYFLWLLTDQILDDSKPAKILQYHNGFLLTTMNDSIKGEIKMTAKVSDAVTIKRNQKPDTVIKFSNINQVRLFDRDSTLINTAFTDYIKIPDNPNRLFRQIYNGKFQMLDELRSSNENIGAVGNEIIIRDNQQFKEITGFWTIDSKKSILEYINVRYSKSFTKTDFKRKSDIIKWLQNNE